MCASSGMHPRGWESSCQLKPFTNFGLRQYKPPLPPPTHSLYGEAWCQSTTHQPLAEQPRRNATNQIPTALALRVVFAQLFFLKPAWSCWSTQSGICGTWCAKPDRLAGLGLPGGKFNLQSLLEPLITSSAAFSRSNTANTPASQIPAPTPSRDPGTSRVGS